MIQYKETLVGLDKISGRRPRSPLDTSAFTVDVGGVSMRILLVVDTGSSSRWARRRVSGENHVCRSRAIPNSEFTQESSTMVLI